MSTNDPHYREAAAAEAAIAEFYGRVWRPRPGDRVRCERPFYADEATGTVIAVAGSLVVVDVYGEHLEYRADELEYAGPSN